MLPSRIWILTLCLACIYLAFHHVSGRKTTKKTTAIDKLIQEYKSYKRFKINHGFSKSVKRTTIIDEKDNNIEAQTSPDTKITSVSGYVKSRVQPKQTRLRPKQKAAHETYEDRHKSVVDSITFVAPQPKKNLKLIMSNPHPDENLLLKLLPLNAKNFPGRVLTEDSSNEYHSSNKTESSQTDSRIEESKNAMKIKTKPKSLDESHKTLAKNKKVYPKQRTYNLTFLNISDSKKPHQRFFKFNEESIEATTDSENLKEDKDREAHKRKNTEYFEEDKYLENHERDKNSEFYVKDTKKDSEFREKNVNSEIYEKDKDRKINEKDKNSELRETDINSEFYERDKNSVLHERDKNILHEKDKNSEFLEKEIKPQFYEIDKDSKLNERDKNSNIRVKDINPEFYERDKDSKLNERDKNSNVRVKDINPEFYERDKDSKLNERDKNSNVRVKDINPEFYERDKDSKLHEVDKNSENKVNNKFSEILEKNRKHHKGNNDLTAESKTVLKYPQNRHAKNAENRTSLKNQLQINNLHSFSGIPKNAEKNTRFNQEKFELKIQENSTFERLNKKQHTLKQKFTSGGQFNSDKLKEYIVHDSFKTEEDQVLKEKHSSSEYFNRSAVFPSSKNHPNLHTNLSSTEKNIFSISLGNTSLIKAANKQHKDNNLHINSKIESIKKSTRKKWRTIRKPLVQNIHIKSFEKSQNNFHKKHYHRNKRPVILVAKIADDLDRNTFVEDIFRALGISDILKVDVSRDQDEELHYGDDELSGDSQSVKMNNFESYPEKDNIKHTSRENNSLKNKSLHFPKTSLKQSKFLSSHALKSIRLHGAVGNIVND
ncbi:repetitive organellar protein isoform X1 [Hydra vulgaris]|uniref:Repetitive organellar protein isoform X1 n=1 Tax=Hydra vulgaris TaxID=6087 RepID=A0ABM4B4L7_HYDVU